MGSIGFILDITTGWPQGTSSPFKCFVTAAHNIEAVYEDIYFRRKGGHYDDLCPFAIVYEINPEMDIAQCSAPFDYSDLKAFYDPVLRKSSVGQ